jgi:hypothetical protein
MPMTGWWRPRLTVRPFADGTGVEVRPSMHNGFVFAARVVPVFLVGVVVSWFLREDLRLPFVETAAFVAAGLTLAVGVVTVVVTAASGALCACCSPW